MGWEQRSRQHLPPGTVCYLCGQVIDAHRLWNRDHVPPQRFYGTAVRQTYNPNLSWLYTHRVCNTAYKKDEEYFVACFAGHADSYTGRAVWDDFRRGVEKGNDLGLLKTVVSQFGRVQLADGSRVFRYDAERAERIAWKLMRGCYFADAGRFLPEDAPKRLWLLGPHEIRTAVEDYPWWVYVRDTDSLGRHGAVLDYKSLGVLIGGGRSHAVAMLVWERLLILAVFHDPSCACGDCMARTGLRDSGV